METAEAWGQNGHKQRVVQVRDWSCTTEARCHAQIASVEGDLALLPPFRDLHHLIIKTTRMQQIVGQLSGFCALETLSLVGAPAANSIALDVSKLGALRHLHIENFAPATVLGPANCTLHASWDAEDPNVSLHARDNWLNSGLWASLNIPLSSFWFRAAHTEEPRGDEEALQRFMSSVHPLDHVSIELPEFGNADVPVQMSQELWSGLLGAKNVHIRTTLDCAIHLLEHNPSWANFLLNGTQADLRVESVHGLLVGLEDLTVCCTFCGPVCLQMAKELEKMDRAWFVNDSCDFAEYYPMHRFTTVSSSNYESFNRLMYCGCHSCLTCLLHEGRLPEDFKVPDDKGPLSKLESL